jgi:polyvinyl alcohol dehydrogenase (cytochrome)
MPPLRRRGLCTVVLLATATVVPAAGDPDDIARGDKTFEQRCSSCHDYAIDRTPTTDALRTKTPEQILFSLRSGTMRAQALGLSVYQMQGVAAYLTGREPAESAADVAEPNRCREPAPPLRVRLADWNGWGYDEGNSRFQSAPGLAAADVPRLKVKWAFGYRGSYVYGQPVIVGGRVFATSSTGRVYALDAATGCTHWTFDAGSAVRSAVSIAVLPRGSRAHAAAFFGDDRGDVYAIDADNGQLLWKVRADAHPAARITGATKAYRNVLYVPVSSLEEVAAADRKYECCTFVGSVLALDVATGKVRWTTKLLPDPKPIRKSDAGTQLFGPAGAAVWSSPTIDAGRQLLYVATGNSYTDQPAPTADAVVALDLRSGDIMWVRQVTPGDNFTMSCARTKACPEGAPCNLSGTANCPTSVGPDFDFGAATILRRLPGGHRVLVASQKSGEVYGLNPDRRGEILWQARFGGGSPLGGIEWGSAADEHAVYVPISDALLPPKEARPGLAALDLATGRTLWQVTAPAPHCSWGEAGCMNAFIQAATAIPGVVFSGSLDGHLRAFESAGGHQIWDFDTAQSFTAVNGVPTEGGSLDLGGPVLANGMLYVNSGYGRLVGHPGNALLAFSVDGQ